MAAAAEPPAATGLAGFFQSFSALFKLPRAFWIVIFTFAIESMAYFGVLVLMTSYVTRDLGWSATAASPIVSLFTALVTLFMLGAGSYAESFGVRRAILLALALAVAGRALYSWLPFGPAAAIPFLLVFSLLVIAIAEGILQPVCYSGVKQYTDERTSSMGYGLIYAIMNGGIFLMGDISARFRPAVQNVIDGQPSGQPGVLDRVSTWLAGHVGSGIQAVNWICTGITAAILIGFFLAMTRKAERSKIRPDTDDGARERDPRPLAQRFVAYFKEGPFANARFVFFIFMLLPVRTLFAHQWLTMPEYMLRAYGQGVADNMERLINWINPGIIFFGVPIATALTRRCNVYTMMIVGSLVSAAPTFLLCGGPNLPLLITYLVLYSIGEALWSARFLEYASELAPPGQLAQYMGLANVPWLVAKLTTGFYAGYMLDAFCPTPGSGVQRTGTLWLIYGIIAMMSPIGLFVARRWAKEGMTPGATGGARQS